MDSTVADADAATTTDADPAVDSTDAYADGRAAYPDIADLGIIGDCRTAALLDRRGGIVWMCAPRFDGPSIFASLLDRKRGGCFRVAPTASACDVERRWVGPTPVLETTFRTASGGVLVLTDLMPVVAADDRDRRPWPEHQILRKIECREGEVEVEVSFDPRPGYGGGDPPELEDHGRLGVWCQAGGVLITLLGDLPIEVDGAGPAGSRSILHEGETRWLSMTCTHGEPAVLLDPARDGEGLLQGTLAWWEEWSGRCRYDGPWRDDVVRSALTLKLLTYAPSGAVVAAVTASLPEVEGGVRNWDYRYCWLRDASWTLRALFEIGYDEEARAFYDWIVYATRDTAPHVQTVYDVSGGTRLDERELDLEGWRGSRPVRVGNGAHGQLQLDVYGETLVAAFEYVDNGGSLDGEEESFIVGLAEEVARRWREPDQGIWEVRGKPRHYTYSKVMCWAGLDRILKLHARGDLSVDVPVERLREAREGIRDEVETRAWSEEDGGTYRGAFDDDLADSALLRLPAAGYVKASDERMAATRRRLVEALGASDDGTLFRRYGGSFDDGLPGREGAFDLVTFWVVQCLALAGEIEAAESLFDGILARGNDLGLFSEEIDPDTGAFLGNFPQAFTHVGLINAALTLEAVAEGDRGPDGVATVKTPWEHHDAPEGEEARRGGPRPYERGSR